MDQEIATAAAELDLGLASLTEAAPAGAINGAGLTKYATIFNGVKNRAVIEKDHKTALHAALLTAGLLYMAQNNKISK